MPDRTGPRILISRMSAIGDAILTLPVACAIRQAMPDAYLAWVVEEKAAPMVVGHDALDEVLVLKRGWFTSAQGVRQARRQLQSLNIDVSIDCQGNTKSALAGWLAGAKRRIGYAGKCGGELSRALNNERVTPVFSHLTDRSLELLSPLEIHSPRVDWRLPLSEISRVWASRWRRTMPDQRLMVINPGGTWASKLWESDRFAATARYVFDRYRMKSIVVWGTTAEREMAMEISDRSSGAAVIAPDTDLHHLAALIEVSDLFLSGDTGPLHMAVAVGTRTIGLYGATRPGDSGPYGQTALQKAYEAGSRRHRRQADNSAMKAIGVEHVCEVIDRFEIERVQCQRAA
ncbi:MAG: glycosyltransferase family 9 protein [Planctomycetota bacterium]